MRFLGLHPLRRTPSLPPLFQDRLAINGTCECTDRELHLLGASLALVAKLAETDPPKNPSKINIIFVDTPALEISFDDKTSLGCHFEAIFLPIGLWRKAGYSDSTIIFAMIEELCHALWLCDDGPQVQQKVESVLRLANPNASYTGFLLKALAERAAGEKNSGKPIQPSEHE